MVEPDLNDTLEDLKKTDALYAQFKTPEGRVAILKLRRLLTATEQALRQAETL